MVYINEDEYPQNYDWLSQKQQDAILDYITDGDECARHWWRMYCEHKDEDGADVYKKNWKEIEDELDAISHFLDVVLGIKVEYGWRGHRNKYFLATYDDAVSEDDYYYDIASDAEGDVDLCYIGGDYENEIDY